MTRRYVKVPEESGLRVKVIKDGKVVASAGNLEVITRYNRKNSSIKKMEQECNILKVTFEDGAKVKTDFGSEDVLENWIQKKAKRFGFQTEIKRCEPRSDRFWGTGEYKRRKKESEKEYIERVNKVIEKDEAQLRKKYEKTNKGAE